MDTDKLIETIGAEMDRRIAATMAVQPAPIDTTEYPRAKYLDANGNPRTDISLRELQRLTKDVHHVNWDRPLPPMQMMRRKGASSSSSMQAMAGQVVASVRDYLIRNLGPLEQRIRALESKRQ